MSTRFYYVSQPSGIPQAYFVISNEKNPAPELITRINSALEKGVPFFINGSSEKLVKNLGEYGLPVNKLNVGAGAILGTGANLLKLEIYRMGFYKKPQRYFFKVSSTHEVDGLYSLFEFLGGG